MAKPGLLWVYEALLTFVFLLAAPFWMHRRRHFPEEMRERFGIVPPSNRPGRSGSTAESAPGPLWFHAASLGEVEAALALIDSDLVPRGQAVFLTVTSTSARTHAEKQLRGRVQVSFAPLDLPWLVDRFLAAVSPSALIILETELWPRMIWGCHGRGIPVFVASGRLSDRRWQWSRILRCFRGLWKGLAVAVQTEKDATRFTHLGVEEQRVCGNVKYRELETGSPRRQRDGHATRPLLWVIASLRRGEEAVLEEARKLAGPSLQVVLAPRHLRDMDHWREVLAEQGWAVTSRTEFPSFKVDLRAVREWSCRAPAQSILLVDVHGELQQWYEIADLASVGGSWVKLGGHNLFEAARAGCSVSFGPHIESVADVADVLVEEQIGFKLGRPSELGEWVKLEQMRSGEKRERAAHHATRRLAGAVERTRSYFQSLRSDLFGSPENRDL